MLSTRFGKVSTRMLVGFAVAALTAVAVVAASPHYIKGDPIASIVESGSGIGNLKVTFKAAGLGNAVTAVEIAFSGLVSGTYVCNNKPHSGDPAPVAFGPTNVSGTANLPVRNGGVSGPIILLLPALGGTCGPGGLHADTLSITWSNVSLDWAESLDDLDFTFSETFTVEFDPH